MASELDVTSDSQDMGVVDVPEDLLPYVKSKIVEYVNNANDFSAKIHYGDGKSAKMVVSFDGKSVTDEKAKRLSATSDMADTNSILVKNLPDSADEELLEVFFESTKRQGGGPVNNVKIFSDKNAAIIEFCERKSVKIVLGKRPIKLGKAELDVQPYTPLLKGAEVINHIIFNMEGLSQNFTDDLMKKHVGIILLPDYGPELAALIKVGSRVVRGRDWCYGDNDSGGIGTVTAVSVNGTVTIKWDKGREDGGYMNGKNGYYTIKLA